MNLIPAEPGLYFVRLSGDELISVNHNDLKRRDRCIMVNSENSKYGIAQNLRSRYLSYCRTFGSERVQFAVLGLSSGPAAIESKLHRHFGKYRMRGLSGRLNEWLAGIDPEAAYRQALAIINQHDDPSKPPETATVTVRSGPVRKKPALPVQKFTPEDIVQAATYLQAHGMSEALLSRCHHFGRQTYNDTITYFTGKTRLQGANNPVYAARLDFIMRGHMTGGEFDQLLQEALDTFPVPY
ncbi:hypothetical protein FQV27_16780 [Paracoccus aurantiacus]|uniref:Uncharacterized protein n=1 Tax=Paracoccus aurantiacus TaxID=2599412 RepID=A0A5C6RU08_9RHOB|nr:hypothetical protein [Paracoccus aurantiacus]TXB65703.1 hypothetical protein FQV27_16780 [Paracoccus aurantiacus]